MTSEARKHRAGIALFAFCLAIMYVSATFKFLHPPSAVQYLKDLGYDGATYFLIATIELTIAVLMTLPATRVIGLLLLSSYLGGAISAHLAVHTNVAGGAGLVYIISHPYVGVLLPGTVLAAGWIGAFLMHPAAFVLTNRDADVA
jgi:hypothetical protein